jgi:predicted kinase
MDKQRIERWTKIAIGLVAAVVISPVVFLAVKGIVGLALALLVGSFCIAMAPVVAMKFANWRVKGIKAEAQENPIETLQNLILAKRKAFTEFQAAVIDATSARDDFRLKVVEFKKKYPARAVEFEQKLEQMEASIKKKQVALTDAQASIKLAEDKLEEMRAYMDMAVSLQEANKKTALDTGDLYEKMKADIAVDSVFNQVNKAFAQLEVESVLNSAPALEDRSNEAATLGVVGSLVESKVPR